MSIAPYLQHKIARLETAERDQRQTILNLLDTNEGLTNEVVKLRAELDARTAERDKLGEALTDMREEFEMTEAELRDARHEIEDLKLDLREAAR